ncbi:MAG TPA: T9SS type A sorting domain-containing protein [Flavobacteriales bacterium]|nr:T9SS type A sorting domain-containing protein [Flavobacteriales bacterium]
MTNRTSSTAAVAFAIAASCASFLDLHAQGGCLPPTAIFTAAQTSPVQLCEGESLTFDGSASYASPGQTVDQWIWVRGVNGVDTTTGPIASFPFEVGGVHKVYLIVVDDIGCASLVSDTTVVLVSPTPSFAGTTAPQLACEGNPVALTGMATQAPMVGSPVGCSSEDNGVDLLDYPATSISPLQIVASPAAVLTDIAQLGDICLDMEHSYLGDLVLVVSCPNGNSVALHQQGGGSTFLGDANDSDDANNIVPGTCFQYCFGLDPEFATLAESTEGGLTPNVIPTSQGVAIAPGRYASVEPLAQLLGCPLNGTWTFSSIDNAGVDNGYLCGWCISFGDGSDSSYIDQGPVLGSSADSSYWSGPGITNDPSHPGLATYAPGVGIQTLGYTVLDSYGCVHDTTFTVSVGIDPVVTITNQPELGLVCASANGTVDYQWSFNGEVIPGAAGSCVTPPFGGLLSVTATNEQGCSGEASLIITGITPADDPTGPLLHVSPIPNDGTFTIHIKNVDAPNALLRVLDMTGRAAHTQQLGHVRGEVSIPVSMDVAPGAYLVELIGDGRKMARRIIVR